MTAFHILRHAWRNLYLWAAACSEHFNLSMKLACVVLHAPNMRTVPSLLDPRPGSKQQAVDFPYLTKKAHHLQGSEREACRKLENCTSPYWRHFIAKRLFVTISPAVLWLRPRSAHSSFQLSYICELRPNRPVIPWAYNLLELLFIQSSTYPRLVEGSLK